jgi:hypothetical protein
VTLVIELLAVQKHEVCLAEKILDVAVPCTSVCVDADVDALCLKLCEKRKQILCLHSRLAT